MLLHIISTAGNFFSHHPTLYIVQGSYSYFLFFFRKFDNSCMTDGFTPSMTLTVSQSLRSLTHECGCLSTGTVLFCPYAKQSSGTGTHAKEQKEMR
jgi:hypothetical protein